MCFVLNSELIQNIKIYTIFRKKKGENTVFKTNYFS